MSKIPTQEQAAKETIELWTEIEKGVSSEIVEIFFGDDGYDMNDIKYLLIGNKHYPFDCPLCEYYRFESDPNSFSYKCPLSVSRYDCGSGCFTQGYKGVMTRKEIKSFVRILKKKLKPRLFRWNRWWNR